MSYLSCQRTACEQAVGGAGMRFRLPYIAPAFRQPENFCKTLAT
ncbi:hypothetical protein [Kingella sp. (in: b-proteobacteria)]|nr:hypothetical protein [Kingella sp. (in: b-proteobacteria)]MDO4656423.1 hypothetical protein [Kingella sp. (in: b-proteobacteria)]